MQYKTKIFISDVTNLSDARYAAGMLVDMIGFPIDATLERHLDLNTFAAITGWLEGVQIAGEFGNESVDVINEIATNHNLNFVSLPSSRIDEVSELDSNVIIRIDVKDLSQITRLNDSISFIHVIGNEKFHLNDETSAFINTISAQVPVLLGCGIDINSLDQILSTSIEGISLKGGEEERPGFKDYDEIADLLEALEV